ncbi:hypothetical protein OH76DRAFT_1409332 [Lentinus brumalis]|uniref:Uncharacterized protein n=1 Tax=Lentinus brumalis TaxID=2498619 RepID=A0A371CVB4_9APHY|nr:hypothetical protein OH76DRAFT_1409332 [Polyporus brumalis]
MSHSSVTHGHGLFVGILPFAHADDVPQSPTERSDTSTTMLDGTEVVNTRTGDHPHYHHCGPGPRPFHSSPTHGHGLFRCPLRSLVTSGLVLSSVTHGHALRSIPSSSSDGEAASPTTPTTPRASRRTTRANSLFSAGPDDGDGALRENKEDLSLGEVLVESVEILFEAEVEKEGPYSQRLGDNRHDEDGQYGTHLSGEAATSESSTEDS